MNRQIIAEHVSFNRVGLDILRDVSFTHDAGRVLAILGPSGSGKTTLLWLLAKLIQPSGGTIRYPDEESKGLPRFGFVFQNGGLWDHLTVRAHLSLVLQGRKLDRAERKARIDRMLEQTGLASLAARLPGQLSGGERQRLSLARAMIVEPEWLFLDEPTSQLDGPARDALVTLLARTVRHTQAGVILATHQVDLAMRLADTLAVLLNGTIGQIGIPRCVYDNPKTLEVARLLGPAFSMLHSAAARLIADLPSLDDDDEQIFRPANLCFNPSHDGPVRVRTCWPTPDGFVVELETNDGMRLLATSPGHVDADKPGTLSFVRSRREDDGRR